MRDARIRVWLPTLDVERASADTIDPHDDGDNLLVLVHVFLDLLDAVSYPLAQVGVVDDSRGSIEAKGAPVPRRVSNEHRDSRIRPERCQRLALRLFPPREVVLVPDRPAALEREVGLAVVRCRDQPCSEPLLVIGRALPTMSAKGVRSISVIGADAISLERNAATTLGIPSCGVRKARRREARPSDWWRMTSQLTRPLWLVVLGSGVRTRAPGH